MTKWWKTIQNQWEPWQKNHGQKMMETSWNIRKGKKKIIEKLVVLILYGVKEIMHFGVYYINMQHIFSYHHCFKLFIGFLTILIIFVSNSGKQETPIFRILDFLEPSEGQFIQEDIAMKWSKVCVFSGLLGSHDFWNVEGKNVKFGAHGVMDECLIEIVWLT